MDRTPIDEFRGILIKISKGIYAARERLSSILVKGAIDSSELTAIESHSKSRFVDLPVIHIIRLMRKLARRADIDT